MIEDTALKYITHIVVSVLEKHIAFMSNYNQHNRVFL